MAKALVQYALGNGYNAISKVRANSNGYKYVTMIDTKDPSIVENVYFGREASELVSVDETLDYKAWFAADTINAQGEARIKLTNKEGDAEKTLISMGYTLLQ